MKRCKGPCGRDLPESEFYADKGGGRKGKCRHCYNRAGSIAKGFETKLPEVPGQPARPAVAPIVDETRWPGVAEFDADNELAAEAKQPSARERKAADKVLKDAAARERRLASDFAQLRPDDFSSDDDFDTSVANDPESRVLSAQAAAEKRQEFSRQMGEHMGAVRRAAIAEETGAGELLDSMPGESGEYIGKLAEQERRFGNRRVARSISLFSAGEELSRRLWMAAARQYLTGRVTPTGYAARGPSTKRAKRSVCLLLSDLHLGADLVAAENPMPFRKVEEARRLEYVLRQAIDYKPQYRDDSELVLMLNGDEIEGLLMHDFRDGAPLTEQKVVYQRYMERFVGECARAYPSVRVFCQGGNHGRDKVRHPGRATSSKWDGHEWQMHYSLMRACTGLPNVTWDLPFRAVGKINLHGSWLGLTHGDTEVKVSDPDTKAKENAQILAEINNSGIYGVVFDAWAFGHFHKGRYQPKRLRSIYNAALIPPNGHARGAGYIGEATGQFLWEAVEGFPVGDVRFIEVGRSQDLDERLGTIIEPFRFDLDDPAANMGSASGTE